jgi:hypothetical protein
MIYPRADIYFVMRGNCKNTKDEYQHIKIFNTNPKFYTKIFLTFIFGPSPGITYFIQHLTSIVY